MDFTNIKRPYIARDKATALRLIGAGCKLDKDAGGPAMNFYSIGFLAGRGLDPETMRRQGLLTGAPMTREEALERGAILCVARKKAGHVMWLFERDEVLETYLKTWKDLEKLRAECARLKTRFPVEPIQRITTEKAREDFYQLLNEEKLEEAIWKTPAICHTGTNKVIDGSIEGMRSGDAPKCTVEVAGVGGRPPKIWSVNTSNEDRAAMGLHPRIM